MDGRLLLVCFRGIPLMIVVTKSGVVRPVDCACACACLRRGLQNIVGIASYLIFMIDSEYTLRNEDLPSMRYDEYDTMGTGQYITSLS